MNSASQPSSQVPLPPSPAELPPCRACAATRLRPVLDLGQQPLANRLLLADQLGEPEPRFPLLLAFCPDCSLTQITCSVPPESLFAHYLYFSSISEALCAHAAELAERTRQRHQLGADSLVVEIASNDGYLLRNYRRVGIPVLGIEPAANIAEVARRDHGVETLTAFFTRDVARSLRAEGRGADVIHANNVLAHVPDLCGFVAGIGELLKPRGVAILEFPYVRDMVEHLEFDTIYHEHLCYFSLTAIDALVRRQGLRVIDVERLAIHGGSLRVTWARADAELAAAPAVAALLAEERQAGVTDWRLYAEFGRRVGELKTALLARLRQLRREGAHIAAYGASAKGATLLNFMGIDGNLLDFVVDRSPHKQGRYTPGTRLPIHAPEKLCEAMPDYALLLTWNFVEEIVAQQSEYCRRGGRFLVPLPEPRVLA